MSEAEPNARPGRWRRGDVPRAKSVSGNAGLSDAEIAAGEDLRDPLPPRPRTRAECRDGARPCPYVGCRHHLYLDVNEETGTIKLNFPHLEVWEMKESCSLDVAGRGGGTLDEVGVMLNLTRERVRQIELYAGHLIKAREESDAGPGGDALPGCGLGAFEERPDDGGTRRVPPHRGDQ